MAVLTQNLGLGTTIIQFLRKFGQMKIDVIADCLNRDIGEIESYLEALEQKGSIKRDGDLVELTASKE